MSQLKLSVCLRAARHQNIRDPFHRASIGRNVTTGIQPAFGVTIERPTTRGSTACAHPRESRRSAVDKLLCSGDRKRADRNYDRPAESGNSKSHPVQRVGGARQTDWARSFLRLLLRFGGLLTISLSRSHAASRLLHRRALSPPSGATRRARVYRAPYISRAGGMPDDGDDLITAIRSLELDTIESMLTDGEKDMHA